MEIDQEILSMVILLLPVIQEGNVSYKGNHVHKVLVNGLVQACPGKSVVSVLTGTLNCKPNNKKLGQVGWWTSSEHINCTLHSDFSREKVFIVKF